MNATADMQAQGMYPLAEAARLAHVHPLTARRWVEGYGYTRRGERRRSDGVPYLSSREYLATELEHDRDGYRGRQPAPVLNFEQLLTLMLVRAFNKRGLGLSKIKKAAAKAQQIYGVENPFVTRRFRSDGNKIFIGLDPTARGKQRQLIDILSDQHQFHEIVEPSLFKDVVFASDRAGEWWPLGRDRSVLVSPGKQFGAPHIKGRGIRTDVVADMVAAEGGGDHGVAAASDWFGVDPEQVRDAVEFEGEWRRREPAN